MRKMYFGSVNYLKHNNARISFVTFLRDVFMTMRLNVSVFFKYLYETVSNNFVEIVNDLCKIFHDCHPHIYLS